MSVKIFYLFIFGFLLVFQNVPKPVQGGKKSLLMGLALGSALRSRGDLHLLHVLIPLKLAAEAWKQYGKYAAYHETYHHGDDYGNHHGYYRR